MKYHQLFLDPCCDNVERWIPGPDENQLSSIFEQRALEDIRRTALLIASRVAAQHNRTSVPAVRINGIMHTGTCPLTASVFADHARAAGWTSADGYVWHNAQEHVLSSDLDGILFDDSAPLETCYRSPFD